MHEMLMCVCFYFSGPKQEMKFSLSEDVARKASIKLGAGLEIPREHRIHTQDTARQSISAFSEAATGELEAEGKVTQRADLQPMDSSKYMKLKQ